MKFAVIRKADAETEGDDRASDELIASMAAYLQELTDAGAYVMGEGLKPSAQGFRVTFSAGTPAVTDGPFTETKELVAGFMIIDVKSRDEALSWVRRWPALDGNGDVTLEVRPLYELEEIGSGEAIEHHARIREAVANRAT